MVLNLTGDAPMHDNSITENIL